MEIIPVDPVERRLVRKDARLKKVVAKKHHKVKRGIKLISTHRVPTFATKPSKCKTPEDVIEDCLQTIFNESFPDVLLIEPICSIIKSFLISKEVALEKPKISLPKRKYKYHFSYPMSEWMGPKCGAVHCTANIDTMIDHGICMTAREKSLIERELAIKKEEKHLTDVGSEEFTYSQGKAIETLIQRGICDYTQV